MPTLPPAEKLNLLDSLEATLLGASDGRAAGASRLRDAIAERGLTPQHAQDLLDAFRMDVTKLRYADWDDLIDYCRYSAMPVGRFVLDVHGESRAHLAGHRRALRRAADHQSPAGLRRGLPQPRPRLPAARRAGQRAARGVEDLGAPRPRRRCAPASPTWRSGTTRCCREAPVLPAQIEDRGWPGSRGDPAPGGALDRRC